MENLKPEDTNTQSEIEVKSGGIKRALKIIGLTLLFVLLLAISHSLYFDDFYLPFSLNRAIGQIFNYSLDFFVIILAFWFIRRRYLTTYISQSNNLRPSEIQQQVNQILESNEFRTSLKNALPKVDGAQDTIWNMLRSMITIADERQKFFREEYKKFLNLTVVLGGILVILFLGMSYFFLNEASTGIERLVVEIRNTSTTLQNSLNSLEEENVKNAVDKIVSPLGRGAYFRSNTQNPLEEEIAQNIYKSYSQDYKDSEGLQQFLESKIVEVEKSNLSLNYKDSFRAALSDLRELNAENKQIYKNLPDAIANLKTATGKVDEELRKNENRIPEVIKRLFITLGVLTFFIAILKYCANLYRQNFLQASIAEQDHLVLKKFFIAYNFAKTEDVRMKVLTTFLSVSNLPDAPKLDDKDDGTNKSLEVLKELLGAFKK